MPESIAVYYEPITSVLGITAYHQNIVYTNSSGQMQFVSSYASNAGALDGAGVSTAFSGIVGAASAATYGGSSVFGTLEYESGYTSGAGVTYKDSTYFSSTTIATGNDLSAAFSCMVQVEAQIAAMDLTYSPLTQNSNSAASSALEACGYDAPSAGLLSGHWSPASGNIIDTSWTSPSSNQSVGFDYDTYGDAMLWVATNDGGAWNQMSVIDNYGYTDRATADLYYDGYFELTGGWSSFGNTQWGGGWSGYSAYTGGYWGGGSTWGGCSWGGSYGGGWYSYWYGS